MFMLDTKVKIRFFNSGFSRYRLYQSFTLAAHMSQQLTEVLFWILGLFLVTF